MFWYFMMAFVDFYVGIRIRKIITIYFNIIQIIYYIFN